MDNNAQIKSRNIKMQGILDRYLQLNTSDKGSENVQHLDEDSLAAFVEGSLSDREARPMVSHLSDCSYCRHISAELIKLSHEFSDEPTPAISAESEPQKVSEVLSGILSRIFGTNDGVVFAHNEEDEKPDEESEEIN